MLLEGCAKETTEIAGGDSSSAMVSVCRFAAPTMYAFGVADAGNSSTRTFVPSFKFSSRSCRESCASDCCAGKLTAALAAGAV